LEDGSHLTHVPSTHLEALETAAHIACQFIYGAHGTLKGMNGSNVIDLQFHPEWKSPA